MSKGSRQRAYDTEKFSAGFDLAFKKSNFEKVAVFMKACDQEVVEHPLQPSKEVEKLRLSLIEEEFSELVEGVQNEDMVEIADALTDILYVVYGTGHAYGIDLDKCFEEVHRSNMTKLVDGKAVKNEAGKVMKPETYEAPNLGKILL